MFVDFQQNEEIVEFLTDTSSHLNYLNVKLQGIEHTEGHEENNIFISNSTLRTSV